MSALRRLALVAVYGALVLGAFFVGRHAPGPNRAASASGSEPAPEPASTREILYWVAPMDPDYRRDGPGKSPMGMDLVPIYADSDGGGRAGEAKMPALRIDPAVAHNHGIRVAPVEIRALPRTITVPAMVMPDADRIEHVHVRTQGWIEDLRLHATGQAVTPGQRMFRIYSPALVSAQQEYLQASRSGHAIAIGAAASRLEALGMSASQIAALAKRGEPTQRVEVRASGPGFVQTLNVREGMYVEPGTTIASIVELSKVWIEGAVPESAAGWMAAGLPVTVRLTAGPDAIRTGRIDYVYPVLDAQTRTLRVRAVFDNADLRLLPGMFAAMTIEGPATTPFVVVPAAAVIRTAASEQVVLALGDGRFRPAEVVVAERVGEWIAVSSGLSAGESVVVSGQFLLDSEASRSAGLLRMLPADDPVSEAPPGHEGHEMPGAHAR